MAALRQRTAVADSVLNAGINDQTWSVDSSFRYCETLARKHYENFPVGSLLLPARLRKHFYSIYAFARTADDFADEGTPETGPQHIRLELLSTWQGLLREAFAGNATNPVFVALSHTQREFGLPIGPFEDLISAFMQDVTTRRYDDIDALLDYCRRSANPIGRLILLLFGHHDPQLHRWSDLICTALQLTNHWQDVSVDLDKDRIYLPLEDLNRFDLSVDDLRRRTKPEAFRALMSYEVQRTRDLFREGKPLCWSADGRLGVELRAIWAGGWRILQRIEESGYDVLRRRVIITFADKFKIISSAFRKGAFKRI